ncbi:MAG: NAD(P)-dependent dehydrogenase (short-subunit alcohol dehydrogenase family) [Paracoccaceae bacterium]|jgi:NAD(P)-dependent dehydrogenase (short-subunit alcohol dehydrogenase family)
MSALPETPSFDLTGKRALVAGASSGIGLGCAVALARAGASVWLAARGVDRLEESVALMRAEGLDAHAVAMDVADLEGTAATVAAHGPFDILVNSAGTARHAKAIETTARDFDAVCDVNIRGAFFLTAEVAKGLIAAGKPGSLMNISSQMGHVSGPERALYSATKFAVEGFTKGMALEWGAHGIRVNTICPTFVRTPLSEPTFADPAKLKWVQSKIALGRVGTMGDIAGVAVWLASDAAALVTGTGVLVDGGWTAA